MKTKLAPPTILRNRAASPNLALPRTSLKSTCLRTQVNRLMNGSNQSSTAATHIQGKGERERRRGGGKQQPGNVGQKHNFVFKTLPAFFCCCCLTLIWLESQWGQLCCSLIMKLSVLLPFLLCPHIFVGRRSTVEGTSNLN